MMAKDSLDDEKIIPIEIKNDQFTIVMKSTESKETGVSATVRASILISVFFLILAYIFVLSWYVFPTQKSTVQNIASNVDITYTIPRYLAVGDENTIEITTINTAADQPANGTMTLVFPDSTISLATVPNQRMSFQLEDLLSGDRLTRQVRLKLSRRPSSNFIKFYFQFTDSNGVQYNSKIDTIPISPISNIRTTWSWITGASGILALVIGFLFERVKNLVKIK